MSDKLANKNPNSRDSHVKCDEDHIYTVDGQGGYISVTKWIKTHFPLLFDLPKIVKRIMSD
jgi:hypothetical protein